jgi:DNA transformation protein
MDTKPLIACTNLGPTIVKTLNAVGVRTLDDIRRTGPARIYQKLEATFPNRTFPVCYYLYSLEGALTDTHWDDIPERRKRELLREIGRG